MPSPITLTGTVTTSPAEAQPQELKKAVSHFVEFFDASFSCLYGYLFWSAGSTELAEDLSAGVYFDAAKKSRRLFLRPELTITLLLNIADRHLHALRKKQSVSVEFSLLEAIGKQCPALQSLSSQNREVKRRQIATVLQSLITLESAERKALILSDLLRFEIKETAFMLGLREGELQKLRDNAREKLKGGEASVGRLPILSLLTFTPKAAEGSLQRLRISVVERCAHLRTTQVHLMVLLGAGAVIANALVSTVVAFAVVTDPLQPLQEKTRPQLAAIDAQLIEERINTLQARIELSSLRADADAAYVKQQVKDHLVAYGLLTIQEEVQLRSGGLAFLENVKQLLAVAMEWIQENFL